MRKGLNFVFKIRPIKEGAGKFTCINERPGISAKKNCFLFRLKNDQFIGCGRTYFGSFYL